MTDLVQRAHTSLALHAEAAEIFTQMMRRREEGASNKELTVFYQQWLAKRNEAAAVMHA